LAGIGNLGVGTTSPTSNLQVVGNAYVSNALLTTNVLATTINATTINVSSSLILSSPLPVSSGGTGTSIAVQNAVFAGPASGGSGAPAFRALASGDIPNNAANTSGTSAGISGSQTANYVYAAPNGSAGTASFRALVGADVPTLNQNTSGSAGSLSTTYGTGQILYGQASGVPASTSTFVYSGGSVGIGTVTPGAQLTLTSNVYAGGYIQSGSTAGGIQSQGAYMGWNLTGGVGETDFINQQGLGSGGWRWYNYNNSAQLTSNAAALSAAGGLTLGTYSNAYTAPTGGLICPGNVGIGTTSAVTSPKLWSASDVYLNGSLYAGDFACQIAAVGASNPNKRLALMYDTSNNISLVQSMIVGTGTTPLILNAAGGNVGIGNTSPGFSLDVNGAIRGNGTFVGGSGTTVSSWAFDYVDGSTYKSIIFGNANSNGNAGEVAFNYVSSGSGSNYVNIGFYGSRPLTVTYNGTVGIGVTNPNATCQIYKGSGVCNLSVQTGDTTSFSQIGCFNAGGSFAGIFFNGSGRSADGGTNTTTLRNDAGDLRLSASGNSPYIYLTGGNVGINTTSPGVPLEVNGAATFGNPWWIITGSGGNATYSAGQVWGSSAVNGTYYGSSVYTGGGASSSQWSGSTGVFTFPQKGVYSITVTMFINGALGGRWAVLRVGSSVSGSGDQYMDFDSVNLGSNYQRNFKLDRYFNANDTFYCQTEGGQITLYWALQHTVFFINKIG